MLVRTSSLLVIFLLVSVASLASYLLSQWKPVRASGGTLGWAGISVGVTLLLTAVVIVMLAIAWSSGSPWFTESAEQKKQVGSEAAGSPFGPSVPFAETSSSEPAASKPERTQSRNAITAPADELLPSTAEPWAATRCVISINPDPAEPTRWTVINGCEGPVGVVIAACMQPAEECDVLDVTQWSRVVEMILPHRPQRPVTVDEETVHGTRIRHAACLVRSRTATESIHLDRETRSSTVWLEQFAVARTTDECLARVQDWAAAGRLPPL